MRLSQIPENGKFQVTRPYTIGGGEHFEKGGCKLTLLPDQVYRVDQSLIGLVSAEGVCHVEQQSKTFGNVNRLIDVPFAIDHDLDLEVVQVQANAS